MKIIGLSVPGATPDPNKIKELAGEEARNAWEVLKAEVVREAYLRKDTSGVVIVLEASTVEAAETALSQLPSIAIDFEEASLSSIDRSNQH